MQYRNRRLTHFGCSISFRRRLAIRTGDWRVRTQVLGDVPKVLGDIFESVPGAIFVDSGNKV